MSTRVPKQMQPPHDAREFACPVCGVDVLFFKHADDCPNRKDGPVDRQREVNETSLHGPAMSKALGSVATDPQPAPQRNGWPGIARLVIEDLKHREAQGQLKYGMVLQPHNGRDPLIDAYQEAIDLAQYLRQAIFEKYRR
jgi:hypothetical protein